MQLQIDRVCRYSAETVISKYFSIQWTFAYRPKTWLYWLVSHQRKIRSTKRWNVKNLHFSSTVTATPGITLSVEELLQRKINWTIKDLRFTWTVRRKGQHVNAIIFCVLKAIYGDVSLVIVKEQEHWLLYWWLHKNNIDSILVVDHQTDVVTWMLWVCWLNRAAMSEDWWLTLDFRLWMSSTVDSFPVVRLMCCWRRRWVLMPRLTCVM